MSCREYGLHFVGCRKPKNQVEAKIVVTDQLIVP
jgi:hypothetical protein